MNMQVGGDWLSNIIWFLFFLLMIFLYPRLMISQVLWRLDQTVNMLSTLTNSAKRMIFRKFSKGSKDLRRAKQAITNFLEFFVIQPVSLDPFGIIRKLEHLLNLSLNRFKYFVNRVAPNLNEEEKANMVMSLSGAISLYQLMKLVRHYVEFIKKTRNIQLALLLQMQIPLIEKLSKALHKGTQAFVNGWAVGDGIGALVAAELMDGKVKEVEEDTLMCETKILGKNVIILKAKGPGGRLGKIGRAAERIIRTNRISKIITIDASLKLEGEKTGSIAEGIGVAIGGIGVDKAYIENLATQKNIPLDSIVIKMSQEEAIMPMKLEILRAAEEAKKAVLRNIEETEDRGKILVIGVGNTCGIGNSKKEAEECKERTKKIFIQLKEKGFYEIEKPKAFGWGF